MRAFVDPVARPLYAAMAAAALSAGCASVAPQAPRAERWVPPPVGATWTVAQRNTGSYGSDMQLQVTRADGTWQGKPVVVLRNSLGGAILASPQDGAWHAVMSRDGNAVVTFDPPIGWQYPLVVGKTWTAQHRMTVQPGNRTIPYDFTCRINDYGDVSVGAGTFPAYRIGCTTNIGNEETYWVSPQLGVFVKTSLRRTAQNPFGAGSQDAELMTRPALR